MPSHFPRFSSPSGNPVAMPAPLSAKFPLKLMTAVKVQVSPLAMSVLTTQTALTDGQNIILRSSPSSQNSGAKRQKQPPGLLSTRKEGIEGSQRWHLEAVVNVKVTMLN